MFTGIIEETGKIISLNKIGNNANMKISCCKVLENTKLGDSIAVNGICLTVKNIGANFFNVDISFETLSKSSLQFLNVNSEVNLERALSLQTRLGGHLVSGHVDDIGKISYVKSIGEFYKIGILYPTYLDKYIVKKGSITVDGISLTVTKVNNGVFEVAVIPHTFENTNLKNKRENDFVNLEVDMIARYLEKLIVDKDNNTILEKILDLKNLEGI
jgi:riboflavin synthase